MHDAETGERPREGWTRRHVIGGLTVAALPIPALAAASRSRWVTSWTASSQGPFPSGAVVALPDQSFAFPDPVVGARDQSFRMIVRPTIWGRRARFRFSNAFGTRPVKFGDLFVGLQSSAGAVVPGTNTPLLFAGRKDVIIPPGADLWSDAVTLPFSATGQAALAGRKLAVSFHVVGNSGPMTWHAKAMQTSYVGAPQSGSRSGEDSEQGFATSTTGWFFLNAVDMDLPARTPLVVCFGDSITDGSGSTLNGDDRWPDVLQRRLSARFPNGVAIVDAGIGSNQVTGPESYDVAAPFGGGPSALHRMERDVASLSGVTTVIWFEGINDLSRRDSPASAETVLTGFRDGVARMRRMIPGVRVVGATITPSLGSKGNSGLPETDEKRKTINAAIRGGGIFDAYVDFERAVLDPQSGKLKPEFVPNSTIGGAGDQLHPNRAGYLAMANAIDFETILPSHGAGTRRFAT
ncbi:MAG: GDSL-type esterase/lipase family protein [Pseudomonadota bacterium]